MAVRLTWDDNNDSETSHLIYRSETPLDFDSLPAASATLGADVTEYLFAGVDWGYFAVGASNGINTSLSAELAFNIPAGPGGTQDFFDSDFSTQPWGIGTNWPSAEYDTVSDRTYVVWLSEGSPQLVRIAYYDHASGAFSDPVTIGSSQIIDDTHSTPALCIDHEGYIYVFWGTHLDPQQWAISVNPRDISDWNVQANFGSNYTYPHPVRVGAKIFLFNRIGSTGDSAFTVREASPSGGVAAFGSETILIDFRADNTGVYVAEARASGTEVEFFYIEQRNGDRQHLQYMAWDTVTGDARNIDSSHTTLAANLPIDRPAAIADYFVVNTLGNGSEIPTWCRVGSDLHVVYFNDTSSPYDLLIQTFSGGVLGPAQVVASFPDIGANPRKNYVSCFGGASGSVEVWYPQGKAVGWSNIIGLDMRRRIMTSGVLGAEEIILTGDGISALAHPAAVHNADPDLRVMFAESAQTESYNDRIRAKRYGYGDSGFAQWSVPSDPFEAYLVQDIRWGDFADGVVPPDFPDRSWIKTEMDYFGDVAGMISGGRFQAGGSRHARVVNPNGSSDNRRFYFDPNANDQNGAFCFDFFDVSFDAIPSGTQSLWARNSTGTDDSIAIFFRGELATKAWSIEGRFNTNATFVFQVPYTPVADERFDMRISRDTTGVIRLHLGPAGGTLTMLASQSIGAGVLKTITSVANEMAYNNGQLIFDGASGGTRITAHDRGTTDADVTL